MKQSQRLLFCNQEPGHPASMTQPGRREILAIFVLLSPLLLAGCVQLGSEATFGYQLLTNSDQRLSCQKNSACPSISVLLKGSPTNGSPPVSGQTISFSRCSASSKGSSLFRIINPSVTTGADGTASTQIIAPNSSGASDCVKASVDGTSLSTQFIFSVAADNTSQQLAVSLTGLTSNGGQSYTADAGQTLNFTFQAQSVDPAGKVTLLTHFNQSFNVYFSYLVTQPSAAGPPSISSFLTPSWAGVTSHMPNALICTFVNGAANLSNCDVEDANYDTSGGSNRNFYLTDDRVSQTISVSAVDPFNSANNLSAGTVQVSVNGLSTPTSLALANHLGGPQASPTPATAFTTSLGTFSTYYPTVGPFYVSAVDDYGNYVQDITQNINVTTAGLSAAAPSTSPSGAIFFTASDVCTSGCTVTVDSPDTGSSLSSQAIPLTINSVVTATVAYLERLPSTAPTFEFLLQFEDPYGNSISYTNINPRATNTGLSFSNVFAYACSANPSAPTISLISANHFLIPNNPLYMNFSFPSGTPSNQNYAFCFYSLNGDAKYYCPSYKGYGFTASTSAPTPTSPCNITTY